MLGPSKRRQLDRPITDSLESLVLADQFYRHLERTLDLSFVRDWVTDFYARLVGPSLTQLSSSSTSSFCTWRDCALSDNSCVWLLTA